jgi:ATP-binding cassette, subfamily C (CFTR/MRP), member 1
MLTLSLGCSITNLVLILYNRKAVPILQSYILESISLASALSLTHFNHIRTRTSSSILLLFWPLYVIGLAIWTRTVISKNSNELQVLLALRCLVGGFGILSFGLECFGPEYDAEPSLDDKIVLENPVITANIFSIWVSFICSSCKNTRLPD